MGIDKLGIYALEFVYSNFNNISDVCSIGRQEIQISENFYSNFLKKTSQYEKRKTADSKCCFL